MKRPSSTIVGNIRQTASQRSSSSRRVIGPRRGPRTYWRGATASMVAISDFLPWGRSAPAPQPKAILGKCLGTTAAPHKGMPSARCNAAQPRDHRGADDDLLSAALAAPMLFDEPGAAEGSVDNRSELLRELMAVFDDLPAALRDAINYAPQSLDPKDLATLCRRHGAANVLAMIELKLSRRAGSPTGLKTG